MHARSQGHPGRKLDKLRSIRKSEGLFWGPWPQSPMWSRFLQDRVKGTRRELPAWPRLRDVRRHHLSRASPETRVPRGQVSTEQPGILPRGQRVSRDAGGSGVTPAGRLPGMGGVGDGGRQEAALVSVCVWVT